MPGAEAVLVPDVLLELLGLPQAASNPAAQTIAIPRIGKALPSIRLFNRTSFLIRVARCRRSGIGCGIVPIDHPLFFSRRGGRPARPALCHYPPLLCLSA